MYRNEYKASCSDLKKKTYCLGETLRRGGGDCVLLWGGRRGDISMTYHCRYSSDTTLRSTALSVQQQHQDLQLCLYNNNSRCIYTATTHQSLFNYCTCEFSTDSGHVRMRSGSRTCPPPSLTATLLNGRLLWPMDRKMMRQTSHCYIH